MKQTENNQRATLNQGYWTRSTEGLRWFSVPPMSELMTRVFQGETVFTATELYQLTMAFRTNIINTQDAYLQHQAGLVDTITLDYAMQTTKVWLGYPLFRALWVRSARSLSAEFAAVIDAMIAETPLTEPVDLVARFQGDLATVRARTSANSGATP